MERRRLGAVVTAVFIAMQLLCACEKLGTETKEPVHVGLTCYNQSDTFLEQMIECFREELEELEHDATEVTITIRDACGSQRTQNDQVKELIDAGCNVLCVNLVDRADPSEIIDLAREADVPIIFFNREPVAEDLMQWDRLYYVGAHAEQSGMMQGALAADVIEADSRIDRNRDGKIQYVILEGEPGHQDAIIRTEDAVDTLINRGVMLEKLSCGIANWNRAQAQNRMMQMISEYQNRIELVLANNDDMALGAVDAYKKLNYTESALPVFFGIDGTDVGLQAVVDGELSATVYNDKEGQAQVMAKLADALVSGKGMDGIALERGRYVYVPYAKVTVENVGEFLRRQY
ncbi:MAG: galactose ABC transporter substrate-binding protein [Eubacterium sp.]|nr:galactose ABC transporter substrate-binding protein [Eubacterium sp.]